MEEIKVSVICTAYNHEKYIAKALESFLMQKTSFKFEVIVHDDASTDKTADIIKEYEQKYPDIIKPIYQKENQYSQGVHITASLMIPKAKGEFIAFCEGDDYWTSPNKLQLQYECMNKYPQCSLVAGNAVRVSENGEYISIYSNKGYKEGIYTAKDIISDLSMFPMASMFFRKSYYSENSLFLENVQNFDYIHKALLSTQGDVYFLDEKLSAYRQAAKGSWTERIAQNKEKFETHIKKSIQAFEKLDEYRNYKYTELIQEEIIRRKFNVKELNCDIKALKKEPYRKIYNKRSFKWKVLLYIKAYCPGLYSFLIKRR
ncbi:MAG: glycosyltransferase [Ruminococcaceae bacterium]|nr:glycosyltransferase [Oscillospiraceae bacterium]